MYEGYRIKKFFNRRTKEKEKELRRELFNLRFQLAKGELQNVKRMKAVKKDIARILTIITEKTMMSSKGEAHKN